MVLEAAPSVPAGNVPVMAKLDESSLPPVEADADKIALLNFFLSSEASTEREAVKEEGEKKLLDAAAIQETLRKYVDDVDSMYDRTGNMSLPDMFVSTYSNGLPIYASNTSVQQHTILAIQTIFRELNAENRAEAWKRKILARLCDAFKACQAEQGRVIDAVYGVVTGKFQNIGFVSVRQSDNFNWYFFTHFPPS